MCHVTIIKLLYYEQWAGKQTFYAALMLHFCKHFCYFVKNSKDFAKKSGKLLGFQ